jgi:hypothetical protein
MSAAEKHTFVGLANTAPGKEAEFADWYRDTHLPDVTGVEGVDGGRRFELSDALDGSEPSPWSGVAIYGFTAEPPETVGKIGAEVEAGNIPVHDAMIDVAAWVWTPADDGTAEGGWRGAGAVVLVHSTEEGDSGGDALVALVEEWEADGKVKETQIYRYAGVSFDDEYHSPYTHLAICAVEGEPAAAGDLSVASLGKQGITASGWVFMPVTDLINTETE